MIDRLQADLEAKTQENLTLSGLTDTAKFNRERVRLDTQIGGLKVENARLNAELKQQQDLVAELRGGEGQSESGRNTVLKAERDRLQALVDQFREEARASDTVLTQGLRAQIGRLRNEIEDEDEAERAREQRVRTEYASRIEYLRQQLLAANNSSQLKSEIKEDKIRSLNRDLQAAKTARREAEIANLARRDALIATLRQQLRESKEEERATLVRVRGELADAKAKVRDAFDQIKEVANFIAEDVGGARATTVADVVSAIREKRLHGRFVVRRRADLVTEQEYMNRFTVHLAAIARELNMPYRSNQQTGRFTMGDAELILSGGNKRLLLLLALLAGIRLRGEARGLTVPLIKIDSEPQAALDIFNRNFVCLAGKKADRVAATRALKTMLIRVRDLFRNRPAVRPRVNPVRFQRPDDEDDEKGDGEGGEDGDGEDEMARLEDLGGDFGDVRMANLGILVNEYEGELKAADPLLAPSIPIIYDAVAHVFGRMSGLDSKMVELQTRADALALRLWGREGIEGGGRRGGGRGGDGLVEPELRSLYDLTREDLPQLLLAPIQNHIGEIVRIFVGSDAIRSGPVAGRPGPVQQALEAILSRPEAKLPLFTKLHDTARASAAATAESLLTDVIGRRDGELSERKTRALAIQLNLNTEPVPVEYARKVIFTGADSVADRLIQWRRGYQEDVRQSVLTELGLFVSGPLSSAEVRGPDDWQSRDTPASAKNAVRDTLRYPTAAVQGLRTEVSRLLQSLNLGLRESQILNPLRVLNENDLVTSFLPDVRNKLQRDAVQAVFTLFDTLTTRLLESPMALTLAEAAVRERSRPALPFVTAEPADQDPRLRLIQPALRKAMFYMYANKVFVDGRLQNSQQQENGDGSGGVRDAGFTDSNLIINVLLKFAKLVAGAAGLPLRAVFNIERLRSEVSGGNFPQIDFADVLGTGIEGGGGGSRLPQPPPQSAAQSAAQESKQPEQKTEVSDINDVDLVRLLTNLNDAQRQVIIAAMNLRRSTLSAHWTARLRRCNNYAEFEDLFHYIVSPAVNVAIVSIYQLLKRSTQTRETFERIPLFELMRSPSFNVAFARLVAFQFARQNDANVARYPRQELQIVGALNDEATLQRSLLRYRPTERAIEWVRQMQGLRVISREGFDWLRFV